MLAQRELTRFSLRLESEQPLEPPHLEMNLRDALRERIVKGVENSSSCCWGRFGQERHCGGEDSLYSERTPCTLHSADWLEGEIQARLSAAENNCLSKPTDLAPRGY